MGSDPARVPGLILAPFAWFTATASFILVIAGGLVTSTGSGLAVPDWPLSYGTLFPPMVGGIRFEHTHRMIAAFVGLLSLGLTLAVLAWERRSWVRWLSVGAFGWVVLQGLLGGLTVLLQLPDVVSIAHACLGQTFFAAITLLAFSLSSTWRSMRLAHPAEQAPELAWDSFLATLAIYLQLILGASLRHVGWGPLLLAAHLLGAGITFTLILRLTYLLPRSLQMPSPRMRGSDSPCQGNDAGGFVPLARQLRWLIFVQLGLGAATFLRGADVLTATAHVATGALLLATSVVLTARVVLSGSRFRRNDIRARLSAYLELTKPRLTFLAVIAAWIGFLMAEKGIVPSGDSPFRLGSMLALLAGASLLGAGSSALNQVLEWERDARMERTRNRPIPSGRLLPEEGLRFGVLASVTALGILTFGCSPLAGFLAAATLVSYLFLYTPLKSRSGLCTLVGALPGALPPLIGWAAAAGRLDWESGFLFSILFLWQLPHFLALAWTHREDYRKAGFQMLPVVDPDGGLTFRQIVLYCLALLPVSLLPAACGWAGWSYFSVALLAGGAFLGCGVQTARVRSSRWARRLFLISVLYLPIVLTTLTVERTLL